MWGLGTPLSLISGTSVCVCPTDQKWMQTYRHPSFRNVQNYLPHIVNESKEAADSLLPNDPSLSHISTSPFRHLPIPFYSQSPALKNFFPSSVLCDKYHFFPSSYPILQSQELRPFYSMFSMLTLAHTIMGGTECLTIWCLSYGNIGTLPQEHYYYYYYKSFNGNLN